MGNEAEVHRSHYLYGTSTDQFEPVWETFPSNRTSDTSKAPVPLIRGALWVPRQQSSVYRGGSFLVLFLFLVGFIVIFFFNPAMHCG